MKTMIFFTTKNTIGIEILNSKFTNQTSYLKLLTGQIGWKARLAGKSRWVGLGGQTGLYLILHLVNKSTLSTNRLSYVVTLKKWFYKIKEYFQRSNLFKKIQRIVQEIKTKKIGENSKVSNDRTTTWWKKNAG